jgi:ABC-2 type transport system permease protein
MRRLLEFYITNTKNAMMVQFQYRLQSFLYVIWMVIEPVIYLVVWSTVARAHGGSVNGFTPGGLAAYYIVWMLVRQMNITRSAGDWEWRIQRGSLSSELMRPIHPIHSDISEFAGAKVFMILLWLPIAGALAIVFKPELHPSGLQVVVFVIAIWGAFLLRSVLTTLLGLLTFWTTRVAAIFDLYFALELLLSGRLVPMTLMPGWVQQIANSLPFQSMFYFPITALTGSLSNMQLLLGLCVQFLWLLICWAAINAVWHFAIRRFASVGN